MRADSPGDQLYENGEYEASVQFFQQALANPQQPPEERAPTLIYLAASLYAMGRVKKAREPLEGLAREYPEHRVAPVRFLPEMVAIAEAIRQRRKAERQFAARSTESEKGVREEPLRRNPPSLRPYLRPEVFALLHSGGRWSAGAGLGYHHEQLEISVRVLLGDSSVFQLQSGGLIGSETRKLFLGTRASAMPDFGRYQAGPVVGARYSLPLGFVALVDLGANYVFMGRNDYPHFSVMDQAGLGFDLRLRGPTPGSAAAPPAGAWTQPSATRPPAASPTAHGAPSVDG